MRYDERKIGKTILIERNNLKLSQKDLGDKIGIVGKQISNYEKGKTIPPIDVMLKLCDIFNCELGYILGEADYSERTKIETAINKETGLTTESMNAIRKITGTEKSCLNFGYEAESYRSLLNSLLSSPLFLRLIECFHDLDTLYSDSKNIWTDVEKRIEKKNIDEEIELYNKYSEEGKKDLPDLEQKQSEAISLVASAMNKQYELSYSKRISRYELHEAFESLVESLYPR